MISFFFYEDGHKRAAAHGLQSKEGRKAYSLRESEFHVSYAVLALERVSADKHMTDDPRWEFNTCRL